MNSPGGLTPGPSRGYAPILCQLPAVSAQPPSPPSREDPTVHLTPLTAQHCPLHQPWPPLSSDSSHPSFSLPPGGLYLGSRKMPRGPPYLLRPTHHRPPPSPCPWPGPPPGAALCSCPHPPSPWLSWPTTLQVQRPPRPLLPGPAVCVDKHTPAPGLGTGCPPPPSRPLPRPPNRPQAPSAPWWTVAGWPWPSLPGRAGQGPVPAHTQVMPRRQQEGGRRSERGPHACGGERSPAVS